MPLETIPYGFTPEQWNAMGEQERIAARAMSESLITRDTNRAAVLGSYGLTQEQLAGAAGADAQADAQRLIDQQNMLGWVLNSNIGHFDNQAAATQAATDLDFGTYAQMGDLTALTGQREGDALNMLYGAGAEANSQDYANLDRLDLSGRAADFGDQYALGGLTDSADIANVANATTVRDLRAADDMMDDVGPIDAGADIYSQAGLAEADGQDVYTQRGILDRILSESNAAGLDSTAGRVSGDQEATMMQQRTQNRMLDAASGLQDLESARAGVYADEDAIDMQRSAADQYQGLDSQAATATADQRSIDAQYDVLDQLRDRSGQGFTAVERAMLEQNRRNEERDRKAYMDARLRDLNARGAGGSGAEIAAMLGSTQQTSENRMLQDMLAMAAAQERAERAQTARASLAGEMRGQSFGEQFDTGSARDALELNALNRYTDLSGDMRQQSFVEGMERAGAQDEFAEGNRDVRMDALSQYGDRADTMRDMAFDEDMTAAQQADAMARYNQEYGYGALQDAAGLSGDIRQQGFEEQYRTGQSSDLMAQYNRDNSLATQQYNTELERVQNEAAWDRASELAGVEMDAADSVYGRNTSVYDAQRDVTGDQYGRAADYYDAGAATTGAAYDRYNNTYDAQSAANQAEWQRGEDLSRQGYTVANSAYDRATDLSQTGYGLTGQAYDWGMDLQNEKEQADDQRYQQVGDLVENTWGGTELYTGNQRSDQTNINTATNTLIGGLSAEDALKIAREKSTGLFSDEGIVGLEDFPIL